MKRLNWICFVFCELLAITFVGLGIYMSMYHSPVLWDDLSNLAEVKATKIRNAYQAFLTIFIGVLLAFQGLLVLPPLEQKLPNVLKILDYQTGFEKRITKTPQNISAPPTFEGGYVTFILIFFAILTIPYVLTFRFYLKYDAYEYRLPITQPLIYTYPQSTFNFQLHYYFNDQDNLDVCSLLNPITCTNAFVNNANGLESVSCSIATSSTYECIQGYDNTINSTYYTVSWALSAIPSPIQFGPYEGLSMILPIPISFNKNDSSNNPFSSPWFSLSIESSINEDPSNTKNPTLKRMKDATWLESVIFESPFLRYDITGWSSIYPGTFIQMNPIGMCDGSTVDKLFYSIQHSRGDFSIFSNLDFSPSANKSYYYFMFQLPSALTNTNCVKNNSDWTTAVFASIGMIGSLIGLRAALRTAVVTFSDNIRKRKKYHKTIEEEDALLLNS